MEKPEEPEDPEEEPLPPEEAEPLSVDGLLTKMETLGSGVTGLRAAYCA